MQFKTNVKVKAISILLRLVRNKASQSPDIPIKALKESSYIFSNFLCYSFNNFIKLSTFPEILKHADITPLYQKGKKDIKGNYRPVNVFPNLSKTFEKYIFFKSHSFENINVGFGRVSVPSNVF